MTITIGRFCAHKPLVIVIGNEALFLSYLMTESFINDFYLFAFQSPACAPVELTRTGKADEWKDLFEIGVGRKKNEIRSNRLSVKGA